jgi:hypothetical protein
LKQNSKVAHELHFNQTLIGKAFKIVDALLKLREKRCYIKKEENRYNILQIPMLT